VALALASLVRADPVGDPAPQPARASARTPQRADERAVEVAPREAPVPFVPPPLVEPEPDAPGATPPVEFPGALSAFYEALERTAAGQGITRVTNLGDSSIGLDSLPHGLRRRFQETFGDAGPGFVLVQPPSPSYGNRAVQLDVVEPWRFCFIIHRCADDGRYGLGGVHAQSPRGSLTRIRPRDGRTVSRAELWYAAQPRGGRLEVRFGAHEETIDTAGDALEDRWSAFAQAPGVHELRVRAAGGGPTRVFGVVLENEGPGVVWDSLSMIGAFTNRLLAHDEAHFAAQLARRRPDLVVFNYGGNDLRRVVNGRIGRGDLESETYRVLARTRAALPSGACLVIGISDHQRSGESEVEPEHVRTVLEAQRAAAERAGCAFWDSTAAMGGPGSFRRWNRAGLAGSDGKHLTEQGRAVIAARLYAALMHARPHRDSTRGS
jgi:lysophospholipase L1-like esterase